MRLYENLNAEQKEDIYLIPPEYVTPFSLDDAKKYITKGMNEEPEGLPEQAYAVYYYLGEWV